MPTYLVTTDSGESLELMHHGVKGMKWGVRKQREPSKRRQYRAEVKAAKTDYKKRLTKIENRDYASSRNRANAKISAKMRKKNAIKKAKFNRYGGSVTSNYTKYQAKRDQMVYGGKEAAKIQKRQQAYINKGMSSKDALNKSRLVASGKALAKACAAMVVIYGGAAVAPKAITKGKKFVESGVGQAVFKQTMANVKTTRYANNPLTGTKNAGKYARSMRRNARKGVEFVSGMALGS